LATKSLYGIAVTLVALLIISATAGAYFFYEYQQADQSKTSYASELTTATSHYDSLASNYNSSLALYNETFALLVGTIAVVNTSLPIYEHASTQLSQLWSRYLSLKPASSSLYKADILVDFGNGTRIWHNNTEVQPGWNMYTETVILSRGDLQAQWYPAPFQEHLITGMFGVSDYLTSSWFLWTYNETASWQTTQFGADQVPVYNGSVFAWTYCGQTPSYGPECIP
jgi:hypothetical protein